MRNCPLFGLEAVKTTVIRKVLYSTIPLHYLKEGFRLHFNTSVCTEYEQMWNLNKTMQCLPFNNIPSSCSKHGTIFETSLPRQKSNDNLASGSA